MQHRGSIFSQKLDRVAFIAYFLGAVVPLVALGVVVDRFVLPTVRDRLAIWGLIGAVGCIAVLSFAAFLVLRRTTRSALEQTQRDNRRLAALLELAGSMAVARHGDDAAETAARGILGLTDATAGFVMARGEPGAAPVRLAAAGEGAEKLEREIVEPMIELVRIVLDGGRPATRGADAAGPEMLCAPLPGEAQSAGAMVAVGGPGRALDTSALDSLSTLGALAAIALRNADLQDAQRNFFTHTTDMLVSALDSHLGYHAGHGQRVAQYANRLGRELGLDEPKLQRLHFAALLHDVGMLKLERHLQIDRRSAARHTVLGARMLGRIRLWQELAPIVQHHHEWWNGAGYPEGISAEAIPLESRIIAVCDAFDSMTSATSYRDRVSFAEALRELETHAGTQFDPDVAAAFCRMAREDRLQLA